MPESSEHATRRGSRRGLIVAIPLSVVALAGIGLWIWYSQGGGPVQGEGPNPVRSTLHLDTFVLNLADVNQRSYLRVGIDLGLNQEAKRAEEVVPIPQVRDTILGVLGEAKLDELMTSSGKTKLKEQLLSALNARVPQLGAQEVYFTEFLIQR